ncbi:neuropeptide-like precursor 1 [Leptidea sinapis]|uniref:neuropeptide-like precursor 1 n=1 Tax=Leptidea sinapis TaxID=189913 RepID=UPI0021392DBE|nr:neuropeptide-like precursor 1 [Leptidea sinapis]
MHLGNRNNMDKSRKCILLTFIAIISFLSYFTKVSALPTEGSSDSWPTFPRRNLAALAKNGYLKSLRGENYKRSISTLAKNGMLPTFTAPNEDADKQEEQDDQAQEKRNLASIARFRSYAAIKRNVQALARDGYRFGRGQYQSNDKRSLASLARNGLIHKKNGVIGDEYYLPFYQNSIPPLSQIDGPYDINELYDYQQSINPDMFPPLQQLAKRGDAEFTLPTSEYLHRFDQDENFNYKRGIVGMPVHGLYRPVFIDGNGNQRNKRSIFSIPDVVDRNDISLPEDYDTQYDDKRSVGSIPLTRISGLGDISLIPKLAHSSIQTTPTYRRRQYLLTRTQQAGTSTER